jgi:site-specific recombinase XerD
LTDDEMNRLLRVVEKKSDEGSIVGKRDYALLLLYFSSGLSRTEIISLRGKDVEVAKDKMLIKYRLKADGSQGVRLQTLTPLKQLKITSCIQGEPMSESGACFLDA